MTPATHLSYANKLLLKCKYMFLKNCVITVKPSWYPDNLVGGLIICYKQSSFREIWLVFIFIVHWCHHFEVLLWSNCCTRIRGNQIFSTQYLPKWYSNWHQNWIGIWKGQYLVLKLKDLLKLIVLEHITINNSTELFVLAS